jgi:hypothetical protein
MTTQHTGNGACRLLHTLVSFTVQTFLDVHRIVTSRVDRRTGANLPFTRARSPRRRGPSASTLAAKGNSRASARAAARFAHRRADAPGNRAHLGRPWAHPAAGTRTPPRRPGRRPGAFRFRSRERAAVKEVTRRRRRVTTAARSERRQTIRRFPDSGVDQPVHDVCTPVSPLPVLPTRDCDSRVVSTVCARRLRAATATLSLWPGSFSS